MQYQKNLTNNKDFDHNKVAAMLTTLGNLIMSKSGRRLFTMILQVAVKTSAHIVPFFHIGLKWFEAVLLKRVVIGTEKHGNFKNKCLFFPLSFSGMPSSANCPLLSASPAGSSKGT